jgi:hypothetical protein
MYLDSRNSSFILLFPPTFFDPELKSVYKSYVKQMLLPYETLDDFMSSTVQSIEFPGWDMDMANQTRKYGKEQSFKGSKPIEDLLTRELTVKFQVVDGFTNYFIFLDNALRYLDFKNDETKQYFDVMRLGWMTREGYLLGYIDLRKVVLHGMSGINLSYAAQSQEFTTFEAKFKFNDWQIVSLMESFDPSPITENPNAWFQSEDGSEPGE